jgi:hypothetical protein
VLTAESGERSPLRRFALGAAIALVPVFLLWWLSVDALTAALRPATAWLAHQLLPIRSITPEPGHGWIVKTSLKSVSGQGSGAAFDMADYYCRRLTLAWPLFVALMLAPPRPPHGIARIIAGLAVLVVLFALSASAVAFCHVVQLANHAAACDSDVPPVQVVGLAYSDAAFFIARFGYNAALMFLPLLAPAVLWLALNPAARRVFIDFGRSPPREG